MFKKIIAALGLQPVSFQDEYANIDPEMKYLIVGLGNPGVEYEETRHNIGFEVVDRLVAKHDGEWRKEKHAEVARISFRGRHLVVVKPTTYMNLSGKAVKYWMQAEKIAKERILVIVDDLALPTGKLRFRKNGSAGGQNGLKHIEQELKGNDYPRLRFGIDSNFPRGKQAEYVLSPFNNEQFPIVQERVNIAVSAIEEFSFQGIEHCMNNYNKL